MVTELRVPHSHDWLFAVFWYQGYLSGKNRPTPEAPRRLMPDMEAIALYVQNWCNANPLKSAYQAGDALFAELPFAQK